MPMMQALLGVLNARFSERGIEDTAERAGDFGPGKTLDAGWVAEPGTALHRGMQGYIARMPAAVHETLRSVMYAALSTKPPTLVTFAWAPAYDFEVTVWQAPDTSLTRGGITVLLKGRYPDDPHPLPGPSAS